MNLVGIANQYKNCYNTIQELQATVDLMKLKVYKYKDKKCEINFIRLLHNKIRLDVIGENNNCYLISFEEFNEEVEEWIEDDLEYNI